MSILADLRMVGPAGSYLRIKDPNPHFEGPGESEMCLCPVLSRGLVWSEVLRQGFGPVRRDRCMGYEF